MDLAETPKSGRAPDSETRVTSKQQRRSQIEVVVCILVGVALSGVIAWVMWQQIGITPRRVELPERLAYAAKWCLVPGATLIVGVIMIANHRFFTPGIDPLAGYDDRTLQIWRRYMRNTLEQSAIFIVGVLAYSTITYQYWLKAIPIVAVLFGLGRALFVIGYFIRPTYRGIGFVMTFYPQIALYGVTIYLFWIG